MYILGLWERDGMVKTPATYTERLSNLNVIHETNYPQLEIIFMISATRKVQ